MRISQRSMLEEIQSTGLASLAKDALGKTSNQKDTPALMTCLSTKIPKWGTAGDGQDHKHLETCPLCQQPATSVRLLWVHLL